MAETKDWPVRLTETAEADFVEIIRWTTEQFGERQAEIYIQTLLTALDALQEGPDIPGVKERDDLAKGVRIFHAARAGRKARHFIVFRIAAGDKQKSEIQILRFLHDSMDLPRQPLI